MQSDVLPSDYKYSVNRWYQVITGVKFNHMADTKGTHVMLYIDQFNQCRRLAKEGLVNRIGDTAPHARWYPLLHGPPTSHDAPLSFAQFVER